MLTSMIWGRNKTYHAMRHDKRLHPLTFILLHISSFLACGMVLVTTIASMADSFILLMASPDRIPWVHIPYTLVAPASLHLMRDDCSHWSRGNDWCTDLAAARTRVPQVSAMSSTMIAVLPLTSPTNTILSTYTGTTDRQYCL